jgi:hypothetical protein
MSADLHLELQKRNARLRAFRALGVPVEGGWERQDRRGETLLEIRCSVCGGDWRGRYRARSRAQVLYDEKTTVRRIVEDGCPHLAPLLQPDPPELAALLDLELLAGA